MERIAVIIDCQKDFMDPDGALYVPGAELIVPTLNEYLKHLTYENGYLGALFTVDTHDEKTYAASPEAEQFPPHCLQGTDGFGFAIDVKNFPTKESLQNDIAQEHIANGMDPEKAAAKAAKEKVLVPDRRIMNKGVFDMWAEEDNQVRVLALEGEIAPILGNVHRDDFFGGLMSAGIDEVEVCGVATDFCVKDAIHGLLVRDFRVKVYDNLVAGIERDIYQIADEEFKFYLDSGQLTIG